MEAAEGDGARGEGDDEAGFHAGDAPGGEGRGGSDEEERAEAERAAGGAIDSDGEERQVKVHAVTPRTFAAARAASGPPAAKGASR